MAETLSRTPHLGFTLALLEMALFRPPEKAEPLFVQPRLVTRTREVVRAIVEVRGAVKAEDVQVTLPAEQEPVPSGRYTLSEQAFLEKLQAETSHETVELLRNFLTEVESRGIEVVARQASLSLHYTEPVTGACFSFGNIGVDASVNMFFVVHYLRKAGVNEKIGEDYLNDLARLIPGARVNTWERKTGPASSLKVGARHVTIMELLERKAGWLTAVDRMIQRINDASRSGSLT